MPLTPRNSVIRASFLLLASLFLCSCEYDAESYAAPPQRPALEDPERWERIVHMTDVDAPEHFVADVFEPLAANWRWTGKRPVLRLRAPEHAHLQFHMDFAIPEQVVKATGPLTLTYLVNEHVLDRRQYTAPGEYTFERDVPAEWISGDGTTLGAEIDKTYSEKNSARAYGVLLIALGLKRN